MVAIEVTLHPFACVCACVCVLHDSSKESCSVCVGQEAEGGAALKKIEKNCSLASPVHQRRAPGGTQVSRLCTAALAGSGV